MKDLLHVIIIRETATDNRYGLMGLNMKDTGHRIRPMAKEDSFMLMGMYTKGIG